MKAARFAFAAHPEALADLRHVPDHIRDLALLELQHLVHGNERGAPLTRELAGCHKVYVDPETRWRLVIQFRDAPAASQHRREIYLLAVGERQDHTAYRLASQRLDHDRSAVPTDRNRSEVARARSAHIAAAKRPPAAPTAPPRTSTTTSTRRVL